MLLTFIFDPGPVVKSAGRVRVLVSGTDDQFSERVVKKALQIQMEENNQPDMRIMIEEALNNQGMLQHARPDSDQSKARKKIIEHLPRNVKGSYSQLQFGLADVIRLLSTRTAVDELDRMLSQSISSHEAAIKTLQRSLTVDEISDLNELLKWVLFSKEPVTLYQLEAAMHLYSGTESLASLQYIIKKKYLAVLKIQDDYVFGQDGVKNYLQKKKDASARQSHSEDRATISMSITINNVDQELCGHFLWDLADKAIRDRFKFNFDGAISNAVQIGRQGVIAVDEFEAHYTIVTRAFEYLSREHRYQTRDIGTFLVCWLPYHLDRLRQLEREKKGALMPDEQVKIGENLYKLFCEDSVFRRHRSSFEQTFWVVSEMADMETWLMEWAVVRTLDKKWRNEINRAENPVRGFLKEFVKVVAEGLLRGRSWDVLSAYNWLEGFMTADNKNPQEPPKPPNPDAAGHADDLASSSSSSSSSSPLDWNRVSTWCQGILGVPVQDLDSLWYERLGELSALQENSDIALSLYQRAIEKKDPSWLCYRGLATAYYSQQRGSEAIVQMELALDMAEREDAMPQPEAKDIDQLHLLLGEYTCGEGDVRRALEHYSFACKSSDAEQERKGWLGYLKATLGYSDAEGTRQSLKSTLAREGGEGWMATVLKLIARDSDHDALVLRLFAVTKEDPDLLKEIVRAMETATTVPVLDEGHVTELLQRDVRFAEDEACGVLFYYRGVAAYRYNVSPDSTAPAIEAPRLWKESRDKLANIGGPNASLVRRSAIEALASYYFESMVDAQSLDHINALAKLAESESSIFSGNSAGFLGVLHARRGDKEQARGALVGRIRQALQMLSDDIPDNDILGFCIIFQTLVHYQDFENASIALSLLGQPDTVTNALHFEANDIVEASGEAKERILDVATKLARETSQLVKSQVPDVAQQTLRIEAAKAHVDSLVAAAETKAKSVSGAEGNGDGGPGESKGNGETEKPAVADPATVTAYRLLQDRLSALQHTLDPGNGNSTGIQWPWSCDGRTSEGKHCGNISDFGLGFYHCVYCTNLTFCRDCLVRLRNPGDVQIMECSAKHQWFQIPPEGADTYVGSRAKIVQVPSCVTTVDGDKAVLRPCYVENGSGREITVEAWKENIAKEWNISLEEIEKEMSRVAAPEAEKKG